MGLRPACSSSVFSVRPVAFNSSRVRILDNFWTVVFAATLITSLINRSLGGTIFSIAFLLIIYAKPLHIESIVPWTVLLAAFLVWGGLRLIFKKVGSQL